MQYLKGKDMGNVIYVPGLQGLRQLAAQETDAGANEKALRHVCRELGWEFYKTAYQTNVKPNPKLSQMEMMVAGQFDDIFATKSGPFILVGSSVGFGVLLGALTHLQNTTASYALLGFKPIPDPLLAIATQLSHSGIDMEGFSKGNISSVPMPVEGSSGDVFFLQPDHVNDPDALRILSRVPDAERFQRATQGRFNTCELLLAQNDRLTQNAGELMRVFGAEVFVLAGDHNTDMSALLGKKLYGMLCSYPNVVAEYPFPRV